MYDFVHARHNLRMSKMAAGLLVNRMDKDRDGELTYADFLSFLGKADALEVKLMDKERQK